MKRVLAAAAIVLSLNALPVLAEKSITVSDAWTRASAPGQQVAGIYFLIESNIDARLIGVETALSKAAELHVMSMKGGVMRMRAVSAVDLPAGKTVAFKPGGYHVMLFDLQQPLVAGGRVQIELIVESNGGEHRRVPVMVEVRNLDGGPADHNHH